jgi:hypothetical protein
MKEQVYTKEVNNRDELLMKINNAADIIRQTQNVLEKTSFTTSSYGIVHIS